MSDTERQDFELGIADRIAAPLLRIEKLLTSCATWLDKLDKATKQGGFMANLSKSSGAAIEHLQAIEKMLKRSEKQWLKLHEAASGKSSGGFMGGLLGNLNMASVGMGILGKAVDGVGWALHKGYEYGKEFVSTVVEAAKQRGLIMTAYEVMLGSRGAAEKQLQKTLDISSLTPASNTQVVDMTKRLLTGQFKGRDLDATRAAALDIQAAFGDSRMSQFINTMTKLRSRGEARNSDVNSFGMYINARGIRENVAKQIPALGYKEGAYDNVMDRKVQDLIKHHGVSDVVMGVAVQRALMEELKQKSLGSYAKKKGIESLAGILSNMEEIIPTFLMRLDIDHFKGIQELKRFLGDILSFFNLGTKEGKMMAQVVEELINELFGGLKNITREDMGKFFRGGVEMAKRLTNVIREAWGWMDKLLHGNADDLLAATAEVLVEVGKFLGYGIWQGFKAAAGFGGREDRRPHSENFADKREALIKQGMVPGTPVFEAALRSPTAASFNRASGTTGGTIPGLPTFDPSGKFPEPAGPPAALATPTTGPELAGVPAGATLAALRKIGQEGAKGLIEGASGPEGLDNRSPSHKMRRVGEMGAMGFVGGFVGGAEDGMRRGGGGVTIHGDLNINVSADSVSEEMRFREWLDRVLEEEAEAMAA